MRSLFLVSSICLLATGACLLAQDRVPADVVRPSAKTNAPLHQGSDQASDLSYILGPSDQMTLFVPDLEEMNNKTQRIDKGGDINFPLAGRFHAAGLTVNELESQIERRINKFVVDPHVTVYLTDLHSQPVSILGAIETPGSQQLEGHKTLFEVLSEAGGLRSDAGNTITITRRLEWGRIPLPDAKDDPTGQFSLATVNIQTVENPANPGNNLVIKPHDMISVSKQARVYCIGQVRRPGGFLLGQKDSLSTLQILSLAEGLDKNAAATKAKIMRAVPGASRRIEIAVNLKQLMAGKIDDIPLTSDDILFVPNSTAKSTANRALEAITQAGTGIAIYSGH
jgi:polysaccharide biosynthesis/export protein